jgi:hypothetical protein
MCTVSLKTEVADERTKRRKGDDQDQETERPTLKVIVLTCCGLGCYCYFGPTTTAFTPYQLYAGGVVKVGLVLDHHRDNRRSRVS